MVLEYCEEGNLRDWLLKKKDKIGDEMIEQLFQIVFGVATGMEYLASKKVVNINCRESFKQKYCVVL